LSSASSSTGRRQQAQDGGHHRSPEGQCGGAVRMTAGAGYRGDDVERRAAPLRWG